MRELKTFEVEWGRGKMFEFMYNSLKSMQATSTQCERNFSAAGLIIVNKLSTRMGDESIKNLSMLKGHFK